MATLNFTTPSGDTRELDAPVGMSVMETAVQNGVPGIVAECGGSASCSTCHVYVDPGSLSVLPELSPIEDDLLDGAAAERRPGSRLSCQLDVTEDLDGFHLTIPDEQL